MLRRSDVLEELAEEEIATGHMIVYTSADSVLQICGNEETFGLEELYRCCEIISKIFPTEITSSPASFKAFKAVRP